MSMYTDAIELFRLRRFALGAGLVLLTWSSAGVTLDPQPHIAPFGLPLQIVRPDLLPFGLALAAVYGAARYFYYALSFGPSPYRIRRDLLDQLRYQPPGHMGPALKPAMYHGATTFISTPWWSTYAKAAELAERLSAAFPRFAFARVKARVRGQDSTDEGGDEVRIFAVQVAIPLRCRIGAALLDLDYTAPVWFPSLSVAVWLARVAQAA